MVPRGMNGQRLTNELSFISTVKGNIFVPLEDLWSISGVESLLSLIEAICILSVESLLSLMHVGSIRKVACIFGDDSGELSPLKKHIRISDLIEVDLVIFSEALGRVRSVGSSVVGRQGADGPSQLCVRYEEVVSYRVEEPGGGGNH